MIGFISCEDMVSEVDVPHLEAKYVIETYISPEDTIIKVYIGKSNPLFTTVEDDNTWISSVSLSINGYPLTKEINENYFYINSSTVGIQAGGTYEVVLSAPGGISCSGSCVVPEQMNTSLQFDGFDSSHYMDDPDFSYYAKYSLTDIAGGENYYRIGIRYSVYDSWENDTIQKMIWPDMEHFFNDNGFDGGIISDRVFFYYNSSLDDIVHFSLILYTTDKQYYDYHRAILNENAENPFSEPIIIPGNVENGLGCVAAYRCYEYQVF